MNGWIIESSTEHSYALTKNVWKCLGMLRNGNLKSFLVLFLSTIWGSYYWGPWGFVMQWKLQSKYKVWYCSNLSFPFIRWIWQDPALAVTSYYTALVFSLKEKDTCFLQHKYHEKISNSMIHTSAIVVTIFFSWIGVCIVGAYFYSPFTDWALNWWC
jgi:hypothetical protein